MEAGTVTAILLDPGTEPGDDLSLCIYPHIQLSDYTETRDEDTEKGGEPAGEVKEQPARWRTLDKPALCVLQKIHTGLRAEADGVKGLTEVVEGMEVLDFSSVLTTLRSFIGSASSLIGRDTEETKGSQ